MSVTLPTISGASIQNNVNEAINFSQNNSPAATFIWWVNKVRPYGDWDYKNKEGYQDTPETQDFGNTNYGATGAAIGLSPDTLLKGAGDAQKLSDAWTEIRDGYKNGSGSVVNNGDAWGDQEKIRDGIKWAEENGKTRSQVGNHEDYGKKIKDTVKTWWEDAKNFVERLDPLTLDLDGDGIETIGVNAENSVLFDHDGDGAKHGTGWISADDAMLVLDRNSNGTIDSGRELFGDSTIKSNGQYAVDGFDALKDIDTNNDGTINSNDTQFANLRLWRDLNQDGVSQEGELFNLSDYNISSLNVTKTENTLTLPNGNQIADTGSFTKTDGSTGNMADVNLIMDRFNREFADTLDTTAVANLPDMQGSGVLRDLREAATQSATLVNVLNTYTATTTRAGQLAQLDSLLDAWADTGGMAESIDDRAEQATYTFSTGLEVPFRVRYQQIGSAVRTYVNSEYSTTGITSGGGITSDAFAGRDVNNDQLTLAFRQQIAVWTQKLHILESFNGSYFFGIPESEQRQGATDGISIYSASTPPTVSGGAVLTAVPITISLSQTQLDMLQKSYEAVRGSVYQSLLLQTRFKPLLDQINLTIDENGIRLDFTELKNTFNQWIANDAQAGLIDLIDFNFASRDLLAGAGWENLGWRMMSDLIETNSSAEVLDALSFNAANVKNKPQFQDNGTEQDDISFGAATNDYLAGGIGDDVLVGLAGNDQLYGQSGIDLLIGGAGNDSLWGYTSPGSVGEDTNDAFIGGKGDDNIYGTKGANTYYYNLGDGKDIIDGVFRYGYPEEYIPGQAVDKLALGEGITASDITFSRFMNYNNSDYHNNDLFINFTNSGDQIIIRDWYLYEFKRLLNIQLADGTLLTQDDFMSLIGTAGNDQMRGDTLLVSNDVINGGAGNDRLFAGTGTDKLIGGSGNDILYGYVAPNGFTEGIHLQQTDHVFEGGTGDDYIYGTGGANTYIYNLGDGADVIDPTGVGGSSYSAIITSAIDKIVFGPGILPSDVTFSRVSGYYDKDLKINFTNSGDSISIRYWYSQISQRLQSIEFADGTIWTQADFNQLVGTAGSDSITGDTITIADETMSGGAGNDNLYGGTGNDTLKGGAGNDSLYGHTSYNTGADVNTTDVFEGGTGDDYIYGTGGANTYIYNLGDGIDTIYPSSYTPLASNTAIDKLVLGAGILTSDVTFSQSTNNSNKDLLISFSNPGDQIRVANWYSSIGQRLSTIEFADGTIWTQADFSRLIGTTGNDTIYGDTLAATNETINGGAGNDTLLGNSGTDNLIGGAGNDNLYAFNTNTTSRDQLTDDTLQGGQGIDYLYGTGGANTFVYLAGDGADIVDASGYANGPVSSAPALDKLLLGEGILHEHLIFNRSSNNFIVQFANTGDQITFTNWYMSSTQRLASITFANGNISNFLSINGTSGNDYLLGTTGADSMSGGIGNDGYFVDHASDIVVESASAGSDTVYSTITYTLGSHLENLTLMNTSSVNATGNSLNNIIRGNSGFNTLNGGDGVDTLIGGAGNDTYIVDSTTDTILENLNEGTDAVQSTVSLTLAANLENLTLMGVASINGTGNNLNNILTGNSAANTLNGAEGNDTLNGMAGNDLMIGGLGDDIYHVDVVADSVVESAGAGNDSVNITIATNNGTYAIGEHIENAFLMNYVNYHLTGNLLNNLFKGNSYINNITDTLGGNDILLGFGGADVLNDSSGNNFMDGGTGTDSLLGGAGNELFIGNREADVITTGTDYDVISFNKGDGQDVINASTGADNTISLGGNFAYSDLSLTKSTNDLIIKMGTTDQITLKDWYLGTTNKSVVNLQVIAEAMQGFSLGGSDALRNNKVERFNFTGLVAAFDAAGATANWQLTDARLTAHLQAGSDSAAIGGDLAYQYGRTSSLSSMGLLNAQSVINNASFGQTAQTLNNPSVWQAELIKLG